MAKRRHTPLPKDASVRRELYYFGLYRVLESALLALLFFGPQSLLFGEPRDVALGQWLALGWLPAALLLLLWARSGTALRWQVVLGTCLDITVATLAMHAHPAASPGIAMLLLFNIGSAALLLPLRYGLAAALLASASTIGIHLWSEILTDGSGRPLAEQLMFAISYCSFAVLTYFLGRKMRASQALAALRGEEAADMAALNELVIRRMRTGVLLVDAGGRIRMFNEAALPLLGLASDAPQDPLLSQIDAGLARRLALWRRDPTLEEAPLVLEDSQTEVLPRLVPLMASHSSTLIFLDDAAQVSRRAESLTLATMGRFSASLAHEIRNPLAAINYAAQLLAESDAIADTDRHMLKIIHQQCQRTNGIVESVMAMARRERATPEHVDLCTFTRRFVSDYQQVVPEENASLKPALPATPVAAMIDPRHLHQVVTALVNNALHHGHMPGEKPRVSIVVHQVRGRPALDVRDRGPGIAPGTVAQLFRPFFTTSEQGTGLGLYIARELCLANQATLDYIDTPGGGGCFRIGMTAPQTLLRTEQTND